MSRTGRTVYVAGAGIAGLTLALALAKHGLKVVVIERDYRVAEIGAGLQLSPNASRILNDLGLADAIATCAFEPKGIDVYTGQHRQPLVTLSLGEAARQRFGAPYAVMHRADLAESLYRACKRFANIECIFGVDDLSVVPEADGLRVTATKLADIGRSGRPFAFVGADGVHSGTRRHVLKGPDALFQRRLAWRTLVDMEQLRDEINLSRTSLLLAPDMHLVVYPLPYRRQVNLALFLAAAQPTTESSLAEPPLPPRHSERIGRIIAAGADWTDWPLFTVEADRWAAGAVGVIGDAAHAMLPFQAQGAAMAIEDAACLAPLLAEAPDAETAFQRYAEGRKHRIRRVAKLSQTNGRIFHMRRPLSLARDRVMQVQGAEGHFRRLGWLYGHAGSA